MYKTTFIFIYSTKTNKMRARSTHLVKFYYYYKRVCFLIKIFDHRWKRIVYIQCRIWYKIVQASYNSPLIESGWISTSTACEFIAFYCCFIFFNMEKQFFEFTPRVFSKNGSIFQLVSMLWSADKATCFLRPGLHRCIENKCAN